MLEPEPCNVCGAAPGADHAEDCNWLQVLRAQSYPVPIDRNGRAWYVNAIDRAGADERARIIAALREPSGQLVRDGGVAIAEAHGHLGFTPWDDERRDALAVLLAAADWLEKTHAKAT